jgi:hypothetical protein
LFFERSTEPYKGNIGRWFVERKYDLMELFWKQSSPKGYTNVGNNFSEILE